MLQFHLPLFWGKKTKPGPGLRELTRTAIFWLSPPAFQGSQTGPPHFFPGVPTGRGEVRTPGARRCRRWGCPPWPASPGAGTWTNASAATSGGSSELGERRSWTAVGLDLRTKNPQKLSFLQRDQRQPSKGAAKEKGVRRPTRRWSWVVQAN